ncbi:anaerobic ribonucleoside-triphosphate reductase [Syntrophomonas curvata]
MKQLQLVYDYKMGPRQLIKRDGRRELFDPARIFNGIVQAMLHSKEQEITINRSLVQKLTEEVAANVEEQVQGGEIPAQEVYRITVNVLAEHELYDVLGTFISFREKRDSQRDANSRLMNEIAAIVKETTRDNANVSNSPSGKMLQIGSESSKWYNLHHMPDYIAQAHINGDIHIHDLDYYEKTINCLQIPLARLLNQGFNAGKGYIRPPQRIGSATALAAIILQSNQNDMYGGQSFHRFETALAPYVPAGYAQAFSVLQSDCNPAERAATAKELAEMVNIVYQAMEGLVYNLNSMHSRAGAQVPFSSLNFGTGTSPEERLIIEQLLLAFEKGLGRGETPLFPNLIFRLKKGVNTDPGDPNYDLFQLACRVSARRMNPTFSNMDMSINQPYGDDVSYMGCRTRVEANVNGPAQAEARGNIGFVTVNLPRLAIKAKGSLDQFCRSLDKVLQLCEEQLLHRYETVCRLRVKDLPFLMGQKLYIDSGQLQDEDYITEAVKNGTLSIGFIGLAEALILLTGHHHGESRAAFDEGYRIVLRISQAVRDMTKRHHLNFTALATPAEGLSGRFIKLDRKKFRVIPGITDKGYYTNSFHIPVDCPISIQEKLKIEGPFHKLCDAGHISYVELKESPHHNPKAVESIIKYGFKQDIGYMGVNFPIDECPQCAHSGIISGDCPVCGNPDQNIRRIRRITGYLSTVDRFGDGKLAELRSRITHN